MAGKIVLEEGRLPPSCPHCGTALTKMAWHKVKGGPAMMSYLAILSCPYCRVAIGAVGG